jgi:APA family basic amino acid/polyamine antiporter
MLALPVGTWLRFIVWLVVGVLIYAIYGRSHSKLAQSQR